MLLLSALSPYLTTFPWFGQGELAALNDKLASAGAEYEQAVAALSARWVALRARECGSAVSHLPFFVGPDMTRHFAALETLLLLRLPLQGRVQRPLRQMVARW